MRYSIRKNWMETLALMVTKPIVIMPFIIIAFLEVLVLELVYFSTRSPISYIANPVVRKFFGEAYLHYPANLVLLPRLFYYGQIFIYVIIGVFLTAISVNIYKNVIAGLPVKAKALVKNALSKYIALFVYAVLIMILFYFSRNAEIYVFSKVFNKIARLAPFSISSAYKVLTVIFLFIANLIFQILFISTVPLIVLEKINLFKALIKSIYLGVRKFFTMFALLSLPFLAYFPVVFIKSFSMEIISKTFPEMNIFISIAGVILSIFIDSFTILCVSRFITDLDKSKEVKAAS